MSRKRRAFSAEFKTKVLHSYDVDGNDGGATVLIALTGTSTHAALTATDFW